MKAGTRVRTVEGGPAWHPIHGEILATEETKAVVVWDDGEISMEPWDTLVEEEQG